MRASWPAWSAPMVGTSDSPAFPDFSREARARMSATDSIVSIGVTRLEQCGPKRFVQGFRPAAAPLTYSLPIPNDPNQRELHEARRLVPVRRHRAARG